MPTSAMTSEESTLWGKKSKVAIELIFDIMWHQNLSLKKHKSPDICSREWQCKEKSHYVGIIYGWSMLKHMFFCRIWRYIYLVLWGGEKQDICHNISKIYDTLALNNLMLILKGRLPFCQLWLNWLFSHYSLKGRTIPEGIAFNMFRGSQCSNHMMLKLLFPEHILDRQKNLLLELFSHISVGSQPS